MKAFTILILLAGLVFTGCTQQQSKPEPKADETKQEDNSSDITAIGAPAAYGGAMVKAKQKAVKSTDLAGINQAIKMFQVQEGRNPKNLNELVSPDYLPKLPDPPRGMKFDYDPATGEVKVVAK